MRFAVLAAVAGFAASVVAQDAAFDPIYSPGTSQEVPVGQPFDIVWSGQPAETTEALVTIALIGGATQGGQVPLYTIATGVRNGDGKFTWTPDVSEYGKNFYGLTITNEANTAQFQYSNPFLLVNPAAVSSTTTATTTVVSTTAPVSAVKTTAAPATTSVPVTSSSDDSGDYDDDYDCSETYVAPVTTIGHAVNGTSSHPSTLTTSYHSVATTSAAVTTPTKVPSSASVKGASIALVGAAAAFALLL